MLNPYDKYKSNAVLTASKEELTLMLYDGALKFCNQAGMALEQKDYMKTNEALIKVQNILQEFQITLDRNYELAAQLDQLYVYLINRTVEANVKKDPEILAEIKEHLRALRDTWKEAMKTAKKEAPVKKMVAKA